VQKTANVPFAPKRESRWLKNDEAAEALAVDVRTIKRWMKLPAKREALSAVQHGKQWRIPRPDNLYLWQSQASERLKKLGVHLSPAWKRGLRKAGQKCSRYLIESVRLWLAAYMKALKRGRITQKARDAILLLWQTAGEILDPLPRYEMDVEKLKSKFPDQLRKRGLPEDEVRAVMRHWPGEKHFKKVRAARTRKQLEAIRCTLDYLQAARDLKRAGKKPTADNLRPLHHKDILAHINGTRETLRGIVVQNPTPEELRKLTLASVCGQIGGKKPPVVTVDFRQPQGGLRLRTFRNRHPRRQHPQSEIVASVYRISSSLPSAEEKPHTGKTPIRKPVYDKPLLFTHTGDEPED